MASPDARVANSLTHSDLSRLDQAIGLIWSVYPDEIDFDVMVAFLEAEGLSKQNRPRLKKMLKASRLVSKGRSANTFRLNPRSVETLNDKFRPVTGAPKRIVVATASAVIPDGTLPLNRRYVAAIVRQINEGYVAEHYDSVAVMLRRLAESLLIECYVHVKREAAIRGSDGNFLMLDGLLAVFSSDVSVAKSRNLGAHLRQIKTTGDEAAHSRTYVTKKVDIDDIKPNARRCISELATLAGL